MTIPRLKAISAYQKRFPPLHIMVAGYLGAGDNGASSKPSEIDGDGLSLFDLMPQG